MSVIEMQVLRDKVAEKMKAIELKDRLDKMKEEDKLRYKNKFSMEFNYTHTGESDDFSESEEDVEKKATKKERH